MSNESQQGSAPWARRLAARRWADSARLPDYLTAAVAFVLWRVFFPGLMSTDSIAQYGQALTGQYNDWHPPLMSIVLKIVLASGGALGILMLAQCLAGTFGVRALSTACLKLFYGDRLAGSVVAWLSLVVLLLLLLPVTPLAFHLMTFWKDTWAMVLVSWICALAIDLCVSGATAKRAFLLAVLGAALGLVRHNAIITLPFVGLALWTTMRRKGRRSFVLVAVPFAIYIASSSLIYLVFNVERLHTESDIMALDLVGLCAESRTVCQQLPWTESHILDQAALARYRPGDIGFIFWDQPRKVDPTIQADYPRLRAEYFRAAREFPLPLARIKLRAFLTLLGFDGTFYFFHDSIVQNPYGLTLNARFAPVRQWLSGLTGRVAVQPVWRWISGVHGLWMTVNIFWVLALLIVSSRHAGHARKRYRVLACVLLVPLSYYLSYLLATPIQDFRFMYPSTLAIQCLTLSWALGGLAQKPTGRAPYLRRFSA